MSVWNFEKSATWCLQEKHLKYEATDRLKIQQNKLHQQAMNQKKAPQLH